MWPFDRPSPLPPDLSEKLDRLLHQQRVILLHLGLKPDPVPRPASPSSPVAKLTDKDIHVVTRQSVIQQERAQALQLARERAGLAPPPKPSPESSPEEVLQPLDQMVLHQRLAEGGFAAPPASAPTPAQTPPGEERA